MRRKIFYLDDESELLELFRDLFETQELKIETFVRPTELVERIQVELPDLIFLDYRLPGTNGIEVARQLPPEIPKVLITGELDVETEGLFIQKFAKPYSVTDVSDFLSRQPAR